MARFSIRGLLTATSLSAGLSFTQGFNGLHRTQPFLTQKVLIKPFSFQVGSSSEGANGEVAEEAPTEPEPPTAMEQFEEIKNSLVRACETTSPKKESILELVKELEDMSEQVGIGQGSANSGLLAGEWSLLYASEDDTRSSPFFWAFRKTFPENSEQIFSITDAIPAPIKEVGPATQSISLSDNTLVSRVKVATLNGLATSIMTTRCNIKGTQGLDNLVVEVESTKPEKSTVLEKLGPLGSFLNENSKPFPSGAALERITPGGSVVTIQNSFCDEGVRICRDGELNNGDVYVWVRKTFEEDTEL